MPQIGTATKAQVALVRFNPADHRGFREGFNPGRGSWYGYAARHAAFEEARMSAPDVARPAFRYHWRTWGDLGGFFALSLDNLLNLVVLAGLLTGVFGFPWEFVLTRMVPGTALGVMVGDLAYTWMAFRLARRQGRHQVTAMPLGLDTPSTIGIVFLVLGPVYKQTGDAHTAWAVGMATTFFMGLVKTALAFCGDWVRRHVPQAGLLGSIGGVGLALLTFFPMVAVFSAPVVGLVALGFIVYTLVARLRLPGNAPGVALAVLAGTLLYYLLGPLGWLGSGYVAPELSFSPSLPWPTLTLVPALGQALDYLPIAIPFGLLTIIGGINVTESARVAGDDFRTRDVLLVEAGATLVAALCGGVVQSTPYIGHPAYKAMGARAGYTLATGLFVGLGGMLGLIPFLVAALPKAAVIPILLFIGLEIVTQAHHATPRRHSAAVVLAFVPCVVELVRINLATFGVRLEALPAGETRESFLAIQVLGHGFILTAMLWGGAVAHLIDRRLKAAALLLLVCALFSAFGLIHSVTPEGGLYLPWAQAGHLHWLIAGGYALLALGALLARGVPVTDAAESM
jgi:AGZA family xanthine/uracil permease-like MFS transporter